MSPEGLQLMERTRAGAGDEREEEGMTDMKCYEQTRVGLDDLLGSLLIPDIL